MAKATKRARKANPRIVVAEDWNGYWSVHVELAGNDLLLCDRGEGGKTWATRGAAMRAAATLRERLAGHDWFVVPIVVDAEG